MTPPWDEIAHMRDRPVLPKLPPSKLKSLDDLLTPEQKAALSADLAEIHRRRIAAEVESRDLPMASS